MGAISAPGPTLYLLNITAAKKPGRKIPGIKRRVAPTSPDPTVAQTGFNQSTSRREIGVIIIYHDAPASPQCVGSLVI